MKRLPITLADGEKRHLSTPRYHTLQAMKDNNVELGKKLDFTDPETLSAVLAAFLTASEPIENGAPAKTWTPFEAGAQINIAAVPDVMKVLTELIKDAYPAAASVSKKGSEADTNARPTRGPAAKR